MARLRAAVLLAIVGGSLPPRTSGQEQNLPHWPRQFSASLEVTTKHLNKTNVYPPAWRTIDVVYDFINKRAGAYVQTSYEKRQKTNGTTTLRRYDLVRRHPIRPSSSGLLSASATPQSPHSPPALFRLSTLNRVKSGRSRNSARRWSASGAASSTPRCRGPTSSIRIGR
jgi:hypothetical protein